MTLPTLASTEVDLIDGSSSEAVASLWGKPPPVRHHSQQGEPLLVSYIAVHSASDEVQSYQQHADYEAVAIADVDDNKYKRKSPLTMLSKWARYLVISIKIVIVGIYVCA